MDALVAAADDWVGEVHPHVPHMRRTLDWLLVLDPSAGIALQIAALTHDIERAFPGEQTPPSQDDPASPEYNGWHQERSARMVGDWLMARDAGPGLIREVVALIGAHEFGGWADADLLQAADSLSFLEVQVDGFARRVADGRLSAASAERKLRFMHDRMRIPRARELAGPMLDAGLARLAATTPGTPPQRSPSHPATTVRSPAMRAYVLESFESTPQMTDVATPEPGAGQVLVRVAAVTVNPVDSAIASGDARAWLEYRFPVTIGRDLAGTIEQVGDGVSRFAVGDRVFGYIAEDHAHNGSFAEYVVVPEDQFIVAQPAGLAHTEAAALGLAAVTAMMCVDAVDAGPSSTVLVSGATGGVGSYAVQIAKARGARVIATARPGDEERHVRELGADEIVDWAGSDVAQTVRAAHPDGIEAVIDLVTGDPQRFAALCRSVLRDDGRAATTLSAADPELLGSITGTNVWSAPEMERLELIARLAGEGTLRAPVSEVYEFDRLAEAFDAVKRGAVGKVAVRLHDVN
jgi:NADPH:quinone reductase-like Zn-dependent oxidoreductase